MCKNTWYMYIQIQILAKKINKQCTLKSDVCFNYVEVHACTPFKEAQMFLQTTILRISHGSLKADSYDSVRIET